MTSLSTLSPNVVKNLILFVGPYESWNEKMFKEEVHEMKVNSGW